MTYFQGECAHICAGLVEEADVTTSMESLFSIIPQRRMRMRFNVGRDLVHNDPPAGIRFLNRLRLLLAERHPVVGRQRLGIRGEADGVPWINGTSGT
jgi:hypothetical protein